jgi:hypothetical protein
VSIPVSNVEVCREHIGLSLLFIFLTYYYLLCLLFQAMVSGAIGGFLDVASNFNSQAYSDDNLIG